MPLDLIKREGRDLKYADVRACAVLCGVAAKNQGIGLWERRLLQAMIVSIALWMLVSFSNSENVELMNT